MFKLLIIFTTFYSCIGAYNILGIFPLPMSSHNAIFEPVMLELAKRGHNVTVYTQFVRNTTLVNYTQFDISECFQIPKGAPKMGIDDMSSSGFITNILRFFLYFPFENFMKCGPMLDLINTNVKYDLFISETFNTDFFFVFAYLLNVPSIGIASSKPFPWVSNYNGLMEHPGYIPHVINTELDLKTIYQRSFNTLGYVLSLSGYDYFVRRIGDQKIRNFLKRDIPSLFDIGRNVSMLFTCTNNIASNRPRLLPPNVAEIGGIHIKPASPLPKDIEQFMNESEHGVVYFSMGSILKSSSFPSDKREALLQAFSKIPQRVLWKWEDDNLPGQPENVMISKWLPQRDILAHPNVKLFISHGGLLGTIEAIYEGVPILGIPIFGDHPSNVKSIQASGAAELLNYQDLTKDSILEKIQLMLNNPSYGENARELSKRYRDRPMSPLDTAVYWTEYVIRHKGAKHLKPAVVQMPWYQYLLLDVVAFLSTILITFIFIIYYLFKTLVRLLSFKLKTKNYQKVKTG